MYLVKRLRQNFGVMLLTLTVLFKLNMELICKR